VYTTPPLSQLLEKNQSRPMAIGNLGPEKIHFVNNTMLFRQNNLCDFHLWQDKPCFFLSEKRKRKKVNLAAS
jgi:hypothetical protein